MTVTYEGNDIYEVTVGDPEHPVEQSFRMTKKDILEMVEAIDKLDYFTEEDFPFFDFVLPLGGC